MKYGLIVAVTFMALTSARVVLAQDEDSRHLLHELGGPFIISRMNVQKELNLTEPQKLKIDEQLTFYVGDTKLITKKLETKNESERDDAMKLYRQRSSERFWEFLKKTLDSDQYKRSQQLELQHEGPAALFRPEISKYLKISDQQRQMFIGVIRELQSTIEPMIREAQTGGNPQVVLPRVIRIRSDYDAKIEIIMNDSQKKQWRAMRGKAFDVFIDN